MAEDDHSVFQPVQLPSALLWGQGANATADELAWYGQFAPVCELLEAAGSRASRRVRVSRVADVGLESHDDGYTLRFALNPGAYATVVLREILDFKEI